MVKAIVALRGELAEQGYDAGAGGCPTFCV
jgi:hypothetical protein